MSTRRRLDLLDLVDCSDLEDAVESPVFVRPIGPNLSNDASSFAKFLNEEVRVRSFSEFVRLISGELPADLEPSSCRELLRLSSRS